MWIEHNDYQHSLESRTTQTVQIYWSFHSYASWRWSLQISGYHRPSTSLFDIHPGRGRDYRISPLLSGGVHPAAVKKVGSGLPGPLGAHFLGLHTGRCGGSTTTSARLWRHCRRRKWSKASCTLLDSVKDKGQLNVFLRIISGCSGHWVVFSSCPFIPTSFFFSCSLFFLSSLCESLDGDVNCHLPDRWNRMSGSNSDICSVGSNLKIPFWIIKSLWHVVKKGKVVLYLKSPKPDIVFVQETHINVNNQQRLPSPIYQ